MDETNPTEPVAEQQEASKPYDREVLNIEVVKFASKKCRLCQHGTGIIRQHTNQQGFGMVRKNQTKIIESICGCAMQRFIKKHEQDLIAVGEQFFWKVGTAPALTFDTLSESRTTDEDFKQLEQMKQEANALQAEREELVKELDNA